MAARPQQGGRKNLTSGVPKSRDLSRIEPVEVIRQDHLHLGLDRRLRKLLIDSTSNIHREEFCIVQPTAMAADPYAVRCTGRA